jgi:hypothetical protein
VARARRLLGELVAATRGAALGALEALHARLSRAVAAGLGEGDRGAVLAAVEGELRAAQAEAGG